MRQIFLFIAILLATAANAQRHTPVEIKQLAYRSKVISNEVLLTWSTFTEDGSDMFTVLKSQDAAKWELITTVPAQEVKDGARYEVKVGQLDGVWYYKLMWTDGFSYATTTPTWAKPVQYNYLGQKTNLGWLIH